MTNRQLLFIGLTIIAVLFVVFFIYSEVSASKKYEACVAENTHRKQPENLSVEIQQACSRVVEARGGEAKEAANCTLDALINAPKGRSVPAAGNIVRACKFIQTAQSEKEKEILKCVIASSVNHPTGQSYNYFYERCEKEIKS